MNLPSEEHFTSVRTMTLTLSRPRFLESVLGGGLIIAALDAANATGFWEIYRGLPPQKIFQSVSAGLLGDNAFKGGTATAWLGVGLHCFIACGVAAVFYAACRLWPMLLRRPFVYGIVYGAAVYAVMNYAVIPLSQHPPPKQFVLPWFLDDFLGHLLLIGPTAALAVNWSARRDMTRRGINTQLTLS